MSDKSLLFVSIQNEGKWQNTGIYQCVASNELGKVFSHNATVEVARKLFASKRKSVTNKNPKPRLHVV